MQQTTSSAEKGALSTRKGPETGATLIVTQPPKVEMLLDALSAIDKISERIGEDRSSDMGSGGAAGTKGDDAKSAVSIRNQKIANLPEPAVMRSALRKHIDKEVAELQREVRRSARRLSRPGAAHKLNALYARIRRLNSIVAELFDAAYDTLKRLFIKVVIDEQKVL